MWRICNWLFGWDYVYIENSAASKIRRAFMMPNGEMAFQAYPFQVTVIPAPVPIEGKELGGWMTVPLTTGVTSLIGQNTEVEK